MHRTLVLAASISVTALPSVGISQTSTHAANTASAIHVQGYDGQIPATVSNGRTLVDLESLARLIHGTVSYANGQVTLVLPGATGSGAANTPDATKPVHMTRDFKAAGVDAMAAIREWRVALLRAVQNNYPVTEDLLGSYRRTAEARVALAATAASSAEDQSAMALLQGAFGQMQSNAARYIAMRTNVQEIRTDALATDPQDQKFLTCTRGLQAIVSNGIYQDVPSCH